MDDDENGSSEDIGYVARHLTDTGVIVDIAGVHAIGSLGVLHYLTGNIGSLYKEIGEQSFSVVVSSAHDGLTITNSELIAGPYVWTP